MKTVFILSLVSILAFPAVAAAGTWNIDPVHSHVGFQIRHFFNKVNGEFTEFSGSIEFDPENPEASSIQVAIKTASINTDNEKRDNHLRSEDFFGAEEHPEITFKSTRVTEVDDGLEVEGVLSMNGVENPVTLEVEFLGAGKDSWGNTRAGFTATAEIDRKDWDIEWNQALDQGGVMLGDDVTINLDIAATLQEPDMGE